MGKQVTATPRVEPAAATERGGARAPSIVAPRQAEANTGATQAHRHGRTWHMGNGAKIGLVGVLALIVLVVAIWDRSNEPQLESAGLGPVAQAPPSLTEELPTTQREAPAPAQSDRLVGEIDHNGPLQVAGGESAAPVNAGGIDSVRAIAPPPGASEKTADAEARASGPATQTATTSATSTDLVAQHGTPQPAGDSTAARPSEPETNSSGGAAGSGGAHTTYRVAPGDTLSKIAKRFYGDARRYYPIIKANRDRLPNPDVLPLGVVLRIPRLNGEKAQAHEPRSGGARARTTTSRAGESYVVKPGDTLYRIAKQLLGSGSRYRAIYEANRDRMRSPDDLRVGMRLVIPRR